MKLGIVDNETYEDELSEDLSNNLNRETNGVYEKTQDGEIIELERGRGEGTKEVPEMIRQILGESALECGSKETMETLGKYLSVSPSSLSAYKNGSNSTSSYNEGDKKLRPQIARRKRIIISKATSVINSALSELTNPDRMRSVKARDLAGIAKDMSGIIKNMEPDSNQTNPNQSVTQQQLVIYAPKMIDSDYFSQKYETIQVTE